MALSGIHITCGYAGTTPFNPSAPPVFSKIAWSETLPGTSTATQTAPGADEEYGPALFSVYASGEGFVSYGPPNALDADTTSVFVPEGQTYTFIAQPGDAISWTTNAVCAPPPEGSLVHLDFVNGCYWIGVTAKTAAEVVDKPDRITFGTGLEVPGDDITGVTSPIDDVKTLLLSADWSIVLEYEQLTNVFESFPLSLWDGVGDNLLWIRGHNTVDGPTIEGHDSSLMAQRIGNVVVPALIGVHRVGMTSTTAKLAVSVDGSVIAGEVETTALTMTLAGFGGDEGSFSYEPINIRSLTIYDPVDDATLRVLSEL